MLSTDGGCPSSTGRAGLLGRNLQIGFTQTPHTCTGLGGACSSSPAYAGKVGRAIRVLPCLEALSDRWAKQAPHQARQMLRRRRPLLLLYRAFPTWANFRCSGKAGPSPSSSGDGACLCGTKLHHLGLSQMLRQGSPLLWLLGMRAASAAESLLTWGQV